MDDSWGSVRPVSQVRIHEGPRGQTYVTDLAGHPSSPSLLGSEVRRQINWLANRR